MNSRGRIPLAEPAAEAVSSHETHSEDFSYEDFGVQALDSPKRILHNPAGDGSNGGAGNGIAEEEVLYEPFEILFTEIFLIEKLAKVGVWSPSGRRHMTHNTRLRPF